MKITVLDANTLSQNDISFSPITDIAQTEFYDILPKSELKSVCKSTDILLCNKAFIDKEVIDCCEKLKYIGLFAIGYDNIDIEYAAKKGITVCNVPDYSTSSVSQLTFSLILMLATNSYKYNDSVHNGEWIKSHTFSYFPCPIDEIEGKTLGILGCGKIGTRVGKIGEAFGMNVIYSSRTKKDGFRFVEFDELLRQSDFLSLHCPLTDENRGIIDEKALTKMKKTAFLINTARGGLVNENDLRYALDCDVIAGAGIDVLCSEPMKADNVLLKAKNCIITPHVAWASYPARVRLIEKVADNIRHFLDGKTVNAVIPNRKNFSL